MLEKIAMLLLAFAAIFVIEFLFFTAMAKAETVDSEVTATVESPANPEDCVEGDYGIYVC